MPMGKLEEQFRQAVRLIFNKHQLSEHVLLDVLDLSLSQYHQFRPMLKQRYGSLVRLEKGVWSYVSNEAPVWIPTTAERREKLAKMSDQENTPPIL